MQLLLPILEEEEFEDMVREALLGVACVWATSVKLQCRAW